MPVVFFRKLRSVAIGFYEKSWSACLSFIHKPRVDAFLKWVWEQITPERAVIALLVISALIYLRAQARRPVIILDLISVPKQFKDAGLTSEVVTQRVRERLEEIQKTPENASAREPLSIVSDQEYPDIEIPETKLSLQVVIDSLRRVLGTSPKHISGEITVNQETSSAEIRCRMTRLGALLKVGNQQQFNPIDSERAINALAEDLTELYDPFLLGSYFREKKKDLLTAQRIANSMFSEPDSEHLYAKAHILLGFIAEDNGRFDTALAEDQKAIDADKKWWYSHLCTGTLLQAHGTALHDQKMLDRAEVEYRIASRWDPLNAIPHYDLGSILAGKNRDRAVDEYRTALWIDPEYAPAHNNLGVIFRDRNNLKDAAIEFRKAIQLDPKYANPHAGLGSVLRDQGKHDGDQNKLEEAEAEYRTAIQLDPKYSYPHDGLGILLSDQNRLKEAEAEYRIAINLDPNDADPHNDLGNVLRDLNTPSEAEAEYRIAIHLDPKNALLHSNLGKLLSTMGRTDEARREFQVAHQLGPQQF